MSIPKSVYIHPNALVETDDVGERTRIWAFAHVYKDAHLGSDCNVRDNVNVETGVYVGDRVTLKNGCFIGMGAHIEDDVFIARGVQLPNDKTPRSPRISGVPEVRQRYSRTENWLLMTRVCRGASIGTHAVLSPGVTVGAYAMVGSGSVVTKDVAPFELVLGVPARKAGCVRMCGVRLEQRDVGRWSCKECSRGYVMAESRGLTPVK